MTQSYLAPLVFGKVDEGIFRSAYPAGKALPFLSRLSLKSMISLHPNDVRPELEEFCAQNSITLLKCDIKYNQDPFVVMSDEAMALVLDFVQKPENQPTLMFCTSGRIRTGCAVACLRKRLKWCMSSIILEFEQFTEPDGALCDMQFVEAFE
jgi:tyrosine-protein phosphatase SIW14